MALSKLAIFSLVGLGTVGTVGAVTAGVVVSQQKVEEPVKAPDKTDDTKPSDNTDLNNKPAPVNLETILNGINESDIVVYKLQEKPTSETIRKKSFVNTNETIQTKDIYPFNVSQQQLGIKKEGKEIPNTVSIEVSLDSKKNTLENLNDGKLAVIVKATQIDNQTNVKTKELVVNTFKKPDDTIKKLLGEDTKNNFILSILSDASSNPKKFSTLEYLNKDIEPAADTAELRSAPESAIKEKVSGLSTLLREVKKTDINGATVTIEGKVKLESIKKESDKTYFYLTSLDKNPIKLTRKETGKNEVSEILVKQVKLNNLAVTSINVVPVGNQSEKSIAFADELKKTWKAGDGNPAENLTVTVPMEKSLPKEAVVLPVKAYTVEKADENESTTFKASLLVTFGSGTFAKTYDTNNPEQLKELKEAEFGFGIYSKDLGENKTDIKESKVNEMGNMLNTYFTPKSNKEPAEKPMMQEEPMKQMGEFDLTRLMKGALMKEFYVGMAPKAPEGAPQTGPQTLPQKQMAKSQNMLVFANYSYPGMENMKVLIAPSLSLINLEAKAATEPGK